MDPSGAGRGSRRLQSQTVATRHQRASGAEDVVICTPMRTAYERAWKRLVRNGCVAVGRVVRVVRGRRVQPREVAEVTRKRAAGMRLGLPSALVLMSRVMLATSQQSRQLN